jgi:hypothetical protein
MTLCVVMAGLGQSVPAILLVLSSAQKNTNVGDTRALYSSDTVSWNLV